MFDLENSLVGFENHAVVDGLLLPEVEPGSVGTWLLLAVGENPSLYNFPLKMSGRKGRTLFVFNFALVLRQKVVVDDYQVIAHSADGNGFFRGFENSRVLKFQIKIWIVYCISPVQGPPKSLSLRTGFSRVLLTGTPLASSLRWGSPSLSLCPKERFTTMKTRPMFNKWLSLSVCAE